MKIKPSAQPGRVLIEIDRKDETMMARGLPSLFRLKKILVPTDFSECSRKALQYALPFARQFGASITLLHVVQINYSGAEFAPVDYPLLERQMLETGEKQLGELGRITLPEDVLGHTVVRLGRPALEIAETAKKEEIDLIIMSTHGRTGLKHVFLGSTAENVVRHAPCPVLTVREHEHEFVRPSAGAEA